jgi:subtilisin family serine protease
MPGPWKTSWHHDLLRIPALWTAGIAGQGVTIALLDTGLSSPPGLDRPDFEYLDATGQPSSAYDSSGHGTCCGSVLASTRGGVLGVAPASKLVSLRVLDAGDSGADVESALRYILQARPDVDVLSCSFVIDRATETLRELVRALVTSGRVIVAAAGDQQVESDFPEQVQNVLTVAALDRQDQPLPGARTAPWIDLSAPGKDLPAAAPPGSGGVIYFSESSAAAPVVAGTAALALSTRAPGAARRRLAIGFEGLCKATATHLADADPDAVGAGRIDPEGLVKAAAAVT